MDDLKPWGSIVYGPDSDKWGISWNHSSRRAAVDDARQELRRRANVRSNSASMAPRAAPLRFRGIPGRWFSATRSSAPWTPRLTPAARLANPAALSTRFVPTAPADRFFSSIGSRCLCQDLSTHDPIALFSTLISTVFGSPVAFSQSGSAGGSIGNDEKSLSGSRRRHAPPNPSDPPPRSKPASRGAAPRHAKKRRGSSGGGGGGGGGNFDGSWLAVSQGCGSATERITISGGTISGHGVPVKSAPMAPDLERIRGGRELDQFRTLVGQNGSGRFTRSDGCSGTWTASKQ